MTDTTRVGSCWLMPEQKEALTLQQTIVLIIFDHLWAFCGFFFVVLLPNNHDFEPRTQFFFKILYFTEKKKTVIAKNLEKFNPFL